MSYPLPHAAVRTASRYLPRLRAGRLPAPRGLKEVTGRVDGASYTMLRPDRCEIAKELYWGNGKRPKAEDANALEIGARIALEADVFIDIGAYTGVFTLACAAANDQLSLHAFEIVPAVADLLEDNVRRNLISDRVSVHREGIGVPGATMLVPAGEGGSALPSFYSSNLHFDDGVAVTFRSLDSLAQLLDAGSRIAMKIDVEGTEDDIFQHGREFLRAYAPDILCEVLPTRRDVRILNESLSPLGYNFYIVRGRDVMPVAYLQPHPRYRDWLFTTRGTESLEAVGIAVVAR